MGGKLASKSVTLNDLERRNGPYFACVISLTLVASGAHCLKVVKAIPKMSATEI